MGTVVALEPHRMKKEWEEEKQLLKEINAQELQLTAKETFIPIFDTFHFSYSFLEEACMDLALESFLSGGKYSKYIENDTLAFRFKLQAAVKIKSISDELYTFMSGWVEDPDAEESSMRSAVEQFITFWWHKGLEAGARRRRLGFK